MALAECRRCCRRAGNAVGIGRRPTTWRGHRDGRLQFVLLPPQSAPTFSIAGEQGANTADAARRERRLVKTHGLHGAALAVPLAIVLVFGLGIGAPRAASQCGKAAWYDRPGKAASGEQASATAMVA